MQLPFVFFGIALDGNDELLAGELLLLEFIQYFYRDGYFESDIANMHNAAVRYEKVLLILQLLEGFV